MTSELLQNFFRETEVEEGPSFIEFRLEIENPDDLPYDDPDEHNSSVSESDQDPSESDPESDDSEDDDPEDDDPEDDNPEDDDPDNVNGNDDEGNSTHVPRVTN